jgi:hypothetical protein
MQSINPPYWAESQEQIMTIYTVKLKFDTFSFDANLSEASSIIRLVNDERDEYGNITYQATQYQTADARHRADEAALLVLEWLGNDYWLNPSDEIVEDEHGNETINGKTVDQYLRDLIVSIKESD